MTTIGLCAHDWDFLGLIISAKTDVIWTNQAGGTACMQPKVEGLFIPLDFAWLPDPDPLRDFVRDYEQSLIDGFLAASPELTALFESAPQREGEDLPRIMEAWVPVRIRPQSPANPSPKLSRDDFQMDGPEFLWQEALKDFAGQIGILTYPNSD